MPQPSNSPAPPPASRLGGLLNVIARRGGWAIVDQAISSIGNFARDVLLVRYLSHEIYGAYGLLMPVMFFVASLHAALIVYPVQVKGAVVDPARLPRFATASLILTLLLCAPLLAAMGVSTVFAVQDAPVSIGWTTFAAVVMLFVFQLQELSRRTLMARLRFAAAVPGDTIAYIGQVLVIYLIGSNGLMNGAGGLALALGAMSICTATAAVVQAGQIGFARIAVEDLKELGREFWVLGKWIAAANFTTLFTDLGYNWMLGKSHALELVADYRVITILNKLTNPVVMTLVGLIVPVVAKTKAGSDVLFAKRVGLKYAAIGLAAIGPYLLILILFPKLPLWLFFRDMMHVAPGIRIFAMTSLVGFCAVMAQAILNGLGRPQVQFWTQVTNTVITLTVGLPLTYFYGLSGALWGGLLATIGLTAVAGIMFIRTKSD